MAGLKIRYVVVTMFIVNVACFFLLGAMLKFAFPKKFKVFNRVNDVTGRERYKLTTMGTAIYLLLQPLILWGILSTEFGAENFA
tara:strand:- start:235 stop:486 length:252 start_codon:yes stop_codon:yes gene_type:complete